MKYFLLGMTCVSLLATSLILFVPTHVSRAAAVKAQTYQQSITLDLNTYYASKSNASENKGTFSQVLASIKNDKKILGASTSTEKTTNTSSESAHVLKENMVIAVLGDSMVDTMGPGLPALEKALKEKFPGKTVTLHNYGVGASNIESGLQRLTNGYDYLGQHHDSLLSKNPDIVVVESFAYNHWDDVQSDLDRHWLTIAKIIDTIRSYNKDTHIILAATVAPNCDTYTDGSANLAPDRKYKECQTVKKYLQNMVNFARGQHLPLADAYHPSFSGAEGNPKYINQGDHIHPSDQGKALFADQIVEAL